MVEKIVTSGFSFLCDFSTTDKAVIVADDFKNIENPIYIRPFLEAEEIDLRIELSSKGEKLQKYIALSKMINGAVFCGITTKMFSLRHTSIVVCAKGRLADIADRAYNPLDDDFGTSDKIKILKHQHGKIGLLIDTDCIDIRCLSLIKDKVDIVLAIARESEKTRNSFLSLALKHKIKYLFVDKTGAYYSGTA